MRYVALTGTVIDTERDLGPAQRHVAQKLMAWLSLGLAPAELRRRLATALCVGWNNEGAVSPSPALTAMAEDIIQRAAITLGRAAGPDWFMAQAWPGRFAGGGLLADAAGGLTVLDAADRARGTLAADGFSFEQVLEDLRAGGQMARQIAALGLRPRWPESGGRPVF